MIVDRTFLRLMGLLLGSVTIAVTVMAFIIVLRHIEEGLVLGLPTCCGRDGQIILTNAVPNHADYQRGLS
jgi:hypothetical protein